MGWLQGTLQITKFTSRTGTMVDVIICYGQIDEASLKTQCELFCKAGEANAESHAKLNNMMMAICLSKLLTSDAQARLLTYRNEFTFDGVEYAPLMYKVIMHLATIDTVATTQTLRDNLHSLGVFAATVHGDINKIHGELNRNYLQLTARGATIDDPIGILFDAYAQVPCFNFKKYIGCQHEDYLNSALTTTHKILMTSAMHKYDYLKAKGQWGAKSPDKEKIVAMSAALNVFKGHLKLDKKLTHIADGKGSGKGGGKGGGGAKKNKKNTSNKTFQKKDEEWKKVPPKDGEKTSKEVGKYTYRWCVHHMAWMVHLPAECRLRKQHKDGQKGTKPAYKANSASYAVATAASISPHFAALMATIGAFVENEEE
jgi:hypothetical protein